MLIGVVILYSFDTADKENMTEVYYSWVDNEAIICQCVISDSIEDGFEVDWTLFLTQIYGTRLKMDHSE